MMAHFQQRDGTQQTGGREFAFDRLLGIARQQHALAAETQFQHQRIVILRSAFGNVIRRRREDSDLRAADTPIAGAARKRNDAHAGRAPLPAE